MTDATGSDDWVAQFAEQCRTTIAEHGHMVLAAGADPDGRSPQFAYTIGVNGYCGCEFAVSGLPIEDMHNALNALARKALDGRFKPSAGLLVEGVFDPPYLPRLAPVDPSRGFGLIATVLRLDERPAMWQAQYPTRGGYYPGDAGYDLHEMYQTDFSLPEAA